MTHFIYYITGSLLFGHTVKHKNFLDNQNIWILDSVPGFLDHSEQRLRFKIIIILMLVFPALTRVSGHGNLPNIAAASKTSSLKHIFLCCFISSQSQIESLLFPRSCYPLYIYIVTYCIKWILLLGPGMSKDPVLANPRFCT